mmetsp:Transcript_23697/g.65781  ORF Transcript_23697/g.65781 Transcript_23697/m.65781 type:complete len:398 (-) Transcript_23697:65-1258(-)
MSLISRLTQGMSRFARDGLALSQAMFRDVPKAAAANSTVSERVKAVLLDESRNPSNNSVAISFLKAGREIGLVRYWGLAEYLRQNQGTLFRLPSWPSSNSLSSSTNQSNSEQKSPATNAATGSNSANKGRGAKVAFMITSSMKNDLIHKLGFATNTVKRMTPQQASLVLHHEVLPQSYDETISKLEEEFREEQRKQQEQMDALMEKERQEREKESKESNIEVNSSTGSSVLSETITGESVKNKSAEAVESQLMLPSNSGGVSQSDEGRLTKDSATEPLAPQSSEDHAHPYLISPDSNVATNSAANETPHDDLDDANLWYEVVEIKTEEAAVRESGGDTEIRHGLYRNREEAVLSLETRQMIQRRRETSKADGGDESVGNASSFVLRPITEEELRIRS